MNKTQSLSALLIALFISACSSTVSTLKEDVGVLATNTNKGYLLIGVETNFNLKDIFIDGPIDIDLSHKDLRKGNNFILVPLTAGMYEIKRINLGYYSRYKLREEDDWTFEIKSQTISYVGHLEFKRGSFLNSYARIELVNRSTEAFEFMREDFPSILNSRDLYYGGPGEDNFFDFVKTLGE